MLLLRIECVSPIREIVDLVACPREAYTLLCYAVCCGFHDTQLYKTSKFIETLSQPMDLNLYSRLLEACIEIGELIVAGTKRIGYDAEVHYHPPIVLLRKRVDNSLIFEFKPIGNDNEY